MKGTSPLRLLLSTTLGAIVLTSVPQIVGAVSIGASTITGLTLFDASQNATYLDYCADSFQGPTASCPDPLSAYASLASGSLDVGYSAQPVSGGESQGSSGAVLVDFLKFSGNTPGQNITITETATAAVSGTSDYASIGLALGLNAQLNDTFASVDLSNAALFSQDPNENNPSESGCTSAPGFAGVTLCEETGGPSLSLSATLPLSLIGSPDGLLLDLDVACSDAGGDASGSACSVHDPITISTPPGVSYTSASGLFLTATPVPLPAGNWLLLSGMGALVMYRRRHLNDQIEGLGNDRTGQRNQSAARLGVQIRISMSLASAVRNLIRCSIENPWSS